MEWTGCSTYSLHDSHSTLVVTGEWEERETGKERWMGAVAQRVRALPPAQPECALWDSHGRTREQPPAVVFWLHTDAEMVCTHTSHGLTCVQMHTCTHMHTEKQTKAWILLGRRGECWFRQPVCSLGSLVKFLMGSPVLICIQPFCPGPQEASRWTDQLPSCMLAQAKGLCRVILCPTTISLLLSFSVSRFASPFVLTTRSSSCSLWKPNNPRKVLH